MSAESNPRLQRVVDRLLAVDCDRSPDEMAGLLSSRPDVYLRGMCKLSAQFHGLGEPFQTVGSVALCRSSLQFLVGNLDRVEQLLDEDDAQRQTEAEMAATATGPEGDEESAGA